MASSHLHNYLLSNRKRLSLSQEEVAFLLGVQDGTQVCRYERFNREPNLATALALEVVLQKPVSELFRGLYQRVEQKVAARAKTLSHKVDRGTSPAQSAKKRQLFRNLADKSSTRS